VDPVRPTLLRRAAAEVLGTGLLDAAVVGSGIMGERLAGGAVLGLIATPVLVVNAASPTVFAGIVERWGWRAGRLSLLVSCSAAWLVMEVMSRWYERQRAAVADRHAAPV
jgi:Zn-dependent protease with chaperone function